MKEDDLMKPIKYKQYEWTSKVDKWSLSRKERNELRPDYYAAIPNKLSSYKSNLSNELRLELEDALVAISRFDVEAKYGGIFLPSILLRSESASSSQIENLTASARKIELALVSDDSKGNAKIIADNLLALEKALEIKSLISSNDILDIHHILMKNSDIHTIGKYRDEQVWIGGSNIGPFNAIFVPPHQSLIKEYIEDWINFINNRNDINIIEKIAIAHAQFETIHPFIDGNGRTGRALIHTMFKQSDLINQTNLPLSAGLLNRIEDYHQALLDYQNGNVESIINEFIHAIFLAIKIANIYIQRIDQIRSKWQNQLTVRKGATAWEALHILLSNPIINTNMLCEIMGIEERTSYNIINQLEKDNIIKKVNQYKRGAFYEARDIIQLFDELSDINSIRRHF